MENETWSFGDKQQTKPGLAVGTKISPQLQKTRQLACFPACFGA